MFWEGWRAFLLRLGFDRTTFPRGFCPPLGAQRVGHEETHIGGLGVRAVERGEVDERAPERRQHFFPPHRF